VTFFESPSVASFTGTRIPQTSASTATLSFSGPARGCIQFPVFIPYTTVSNQSQLACGFQFVIPASDADRAVAQWYPLLLPPPAPVSDIGFAASIDPGDPLNAALPNSTVFAFTGSNRDGSPTVLWSAFTTTSGTAIELTPAAGTYPAALVLNVGTATGVPAQQFQFAPQGDFTLGVASPETAAVYGLLCGLQGTEWTGFQPTVPSGYAGDRVRFASRQPAFAAGYPPPLSSPVSKPIDPKAPLLDRSSHYKTSWATVVRNGTGGIPYVSQPEGASLYGRDPLVNKSAATLLGSETPCTVLPQGVYFPMVPYGAVALAPAPALSAPQIEDLEARVVSPTRRALIGNTNPAQSPEVALDLAPAVPPFNATTPSGLLITIGTDGRWTKVLLGQNTSPSMRQLAFCLPDDQLQQALATNNVFLVVANAQHLGQPASGDGSCLAGAPSFYNTMNIEDWDLAAEVGMNNAGDYSNILILKGRAGALYDPTNAQTRQASLVSNPDSWTQRETFAAPSTRPGKDKPPGPPDPSQLASLSLWLQRYFQTASEQPDGDFFGHFNTIAKDPNWTGLLVLRAKIKNIPSGLGPLQAGITAPDRFYAHHFAVELNQVDNDPAQSQIKLSGKSSIFGLIYYVDPAFVLPTAGQPPKPVQPPSGVDYDFRTLSLQALFQNTTIKSFRSYAQVTFNQVFGSDVTHMGPGGNPYNSIVLDGSLQHDNGQAVYSLSSATDTSLYLDSNVITKVEVTQAQMSTRSPGSDPAVAWFGLSGFIDLAVVTVGSGKSQVPFDIFSFGSPAGTDELRAGLSYSNLGLEMSYPQANPTQRTLSFVAGQITFDIARSTPRPGSLYTNLALQLQGFQAGAPDASPGQTGYLSVVTDAPLGGVGADQWYGLRYQLNLGTPGKLAGDIGLTSSLLTAWSPASSGSRYQAMVGLALPGTGGDSKLFSLQSVLKLSIDQIRLVRVTSGSSPSFLLMFTDIALKFLGLLKIPPNGSTLFYLFGNPSGDGNASGLGWYAMYRQNSKQLSPVPASLEVA
jgi:hypothetical protein